MDDTPLGRDKSKRARSNPVVERRLHDRRLAVEGHVGHYDMTVHVSHFCSDS